jgi:hypothetical protein
MKRLLLLSTAVLFAVACQDHKSPVAPNGPAHVPSFATVATPSGATFTTDKDDYAPGETLNLSGTGWQPADVLDVHLDEIPQNHPPVDWTIAVDENGAFTDGTYVVQQSDAGVTFDITATSRATGETVTATFTDDPPLPGAIFTTDNTCSGVDLNIYASKMDVYLDGGPAHEGAAGLPDGDYYVQVTDPSGATVLGTSVGSSDETPVHVSGGEFATCYQLWAILIKGSGATTGYDDTPNAGGEYKVWVSTVSTFDNSSTKTDNFKVEAGGGGGEQEVGTLQACKYEDANANGQKDVGEAALAGWSMTIVPTDNVAEDATQETGAGGCVTWTITLPTGAAASYAVTEAAPTGGLPWFNTDPGSNGPCLIQAGGCPAPQKSVDFVAGDAAEIYFGNIQSAEKHGQKFYDANTNGSNDDGQVVQGWEITLTGTDLLGGAVGPTDMFTDGSGNYAFVDLLPSFQPGDNYTVTEGTATSTSWIHTTGTSIAFSLAAGQIETGNDFGNVCVGAGNGHTLGFWSNKNGEKAMTNGAGGMEGALALLTGLALRNADGSDFDPPSYGDFRTWLLAATAENMAYMLSAQLAAMELNVYEGFVDGGALIYAPGTSSANANGFATVSAVMAEANDELGVHGTAFSGDSWRSYQEALKNALDQANNNLSFVQATPATCPVPDFGAPPTE